MFKVDLALSRVQSEMHGLWVVLESMEDHLRIASDLEADGIIERATSEWDDPDAAISIANDQIAFLRDVIFPRLFRGSYIVTLFAAFEDGLTTMSRRVQLGQPNVYSLGRHGRLSSRAEGLFQGRLEMDFATDTDLQRLELLEETRNVFAHQAGRLALDDWTSRRRKGSRIYNVCESRARMFERWSVNGGPRVELNEYLVPSYGFCEENLRLVTRIQRRLAAQVDSSFQWASDAG